MFRETVAEHGKIKHDAMRRGESRPPPESQKCDLVCSGQFLSIGVHVNFESDGNDTQVCPQANFERSNWQNVKAEMKRVWMGQQQILEQISPRLE